MVEEEILQSENGNDLPADFVPLPSRGKIYNKDSFFYRKKTVEYKAMTPRQEDILLNSAYRKKEIAVEKMVSSCLMTQGIDISNMLIGDKDALMVSIRISGYGRLFEPVLACPKCEVQSTLHFDLATIPIKFLEIVPEIKGENLFKFMLPISKREVLFKFLTVEEERQFNQEMSKSDIREYSTVTSALSNSILSIDGVTDRRQISRFVSGMRAGDSSALRKYIEVHKPGLDMRTDFSCSVCPHSEIISIPTNHKFFSIDPEHREMVFLEPFFLLGYYFGMDYKTYYNMPLSYRKWLIERIGKEIKKASEANAEGASNIPSKGAHHNVPDARALAGKARSHVPAKLRRF